MHERGDADHELIDEHERDKFAGTSADPDGTHGRSEPRRAPSSRRAARSATRRSASSDGRFTRDEQPTDAPGSRRA